MNNLDDIEAIKQLDAENVLGSIEQLGGQCQQAWEEASNIQFPGEYRDVSSIVFSGMGGSALGAYVVKSLTSDLLPVPFEIINNYTLPAYVSSNTLVIVSSYSGSTEESVASCEHALKIGAKVTGITTGGKLGQLLTQAKMPAYIFTPRYNPSKQPRLGMGYSVIGLLAILQSIGFLTISDEERNETITTLERGNAMYGISVPADNNRGKQSAAAWKDKIPVIVSAEFLTHVGRVIRNQFHESAKTFATYQDIPELNHHLMEGLSNPGSNKTNLQFLFLMSKNYSNKIQKRMKITRDVVIKQGIASEVFETTAKGTLAQSFECIQFGAYVNYYMSMLYDVNPSKIPWVDYFKAELAKT